MVQLEEVDVVVWDLEGLLGNKREAGKAKRKHVGDDHYAPIWLKIARASAAGSGASVIGRPTTMWLAPEVIAWAGVTTRTWSATFPPAGRAAGVTTAKSPPNSERTRGASWPAATAPVQRFAGTTVARRKN